MSWWGDVKEMVHWRVRLVAAAWLVVGVGMATLGMEPRLVLLGFVVVIVAAAIWLIRDLAPVSVPLVWDKSVASGGVKEREDMRVRMLRNRLRSSRTKRAGRMIARPDNLEPDEHIVASLVGVVDHHLLAEHGIDRTVDPSSAATILGPELSRFVSDATAQRPLTGRRSFARTLRLIEDLTLSKPNVSQPNMSQPPNTTT